MFLSDAQAATLIDPSARHINFCIRLLRIAFYDTETSVATYMYNHLVPGADTASHQFTFSAHKDCGEDVQTLLALRQWWERERAAQGGVMEQVVYRVEEFFQEDYCWELMEASEYRLSKRRRRMSNLGRYRRFVRGAGICRDCSGSSAKGTTVTYVLPPIRSPL